MIYIDGSLTFLTLSRRHDWFADRLDEIVMAVALGCGIDREDAGSATFRARRRGGRRRRGSRPIYFGANAES